MPLKRIHIGPWKISCDPEETQAIYAKIVHGNPEVCRCWGCLNFAVVRKEVHPPSAVSVFEQLGIDLYKETDLLHVDVGVYRGWYHFIGRMEYGFHETVDIGNYYKLDVTDAVERSSKLFGNLPVAQINFLASEVRWTLSSPESDQFLEDSDEEAISDDTAYNTV
jgi:hypothetical protein